MLLAWSFAAALLSPTKAIEGSWTLKSIYRTGNVEGLSPSEQWKLIGSKIVIDAQHLRACGQSIPIRSRVIQSVDAREFLANTKVRFEDVGINRSKVSEIILNNRSAGRCFGSFPTPGQLLYVKSKNELLIDFEGTFYRAVRAD